MKVRIKKLVPEAVVPQKATEGSAAYDVYLPANSIIHTGRQVVSLGLAIEVPYGYEAKIEPRSGFSSKGMEDKYGERQNADVIQGKIDSDYRGEIGVIINSDEHFPFTLKKGTRIAQMTIYRVEDAEFEEAEELSETERTGGFGSTGTGI